MTLGMDELVSRDSEDVRLVAFWQKKRKREIFFSEFLSRLRAANDFKSLLKMRCVAGLHFPPLFYQKKNNNNKPNETFGPGKIMAIVNLVERFLTT